MLKSFCAGVDEDLETSINWNPLDTPTAQELAQTNLTKAQTGLALVQAGAIDSSDERMRIATDKTSGYNELGLEDQDDELEGQEEVDPEDQNESD